MSDYPEQMMGMTVEDKQLCVAVDWFAQQMKEKLIAKANEGWDGWRATGYIEGGRNLQQIGNHFDRLRNGEPQEVDIANLCMFRAFYRHTEAEQARLDEANAKENKHEEPNLSNMPPKHE